MHKIFYLTTGLLIFFIGCGPEFENNQFFAVASQQLNAQPAKSKAKALTIAEVDDLMEENKNLDANGPDFQSEIASIEEFPLFESTPTGSYIDALIPNETKAEKIKKAAEKLVSHIAASPVCKKSCSPEFKQASPSKKKLLQSRLAEITKEIVLNEIRNQGNFISYYHGFPNDFRLYQDVLRSVKSFEHLNRLTNTYPFRDFAFNDKRVLLHNFLKNWWQEYLDYAQSKNMPPFPTKDIDAPGQSIGLTFYPDSITYAQNYLLSTNVNFLGNNLSPLNSSVFFLLNSTSATGLDIVDWLIEKTLTPYLKNSDGSFNKAKFDEILSQLKSIFNRYMAKSGGQLVQILVKNQIAPKVSFMAWNGGEPIWSSKQTKRAIFATDEDGNEVFKPSNVFWPTTAEQINDYVLPNIVSLMTLFVDYPKYLANFFPVRQRIKLLAGASFIQKHPKDEKTAIFVSRDIMQARLLPNPEYFSDESITGAKIYTVYPIDENHQAAYEQEIFDTIRDVFTDFLANTDSLDDFKDGDYRLKSAFESLNKTEEK